MIGFDTLPGGNQIVNNQLPKLRSGIEFLLTLTNDKSGDLKVTSAYDQYSYLYGFQKKLIPWDPAWEQENNGIFLPWKLCLSYPLFLPASKQNIPFEDLDIGQLKAGNTDPGSPDYNSLADFYAGKNLLEIRIPWMMLGYTDPSTHQAWSYPYHYKIPRITNSKSTGVDIYMIVNNKNNPSQSSILSPLSYIS